MSHVITFIIGAAIALVIANNTATALELMVKAWRWIKSKF